MPRRLLWRTIRSRGAKIADDIELGSVDANGELTLWSNANDVESVRLSGSLHQISTYGNDGLEQIRLWGPSWGELLLNDTTGNQTAVLLSANGDSGGLLQLREGNGSNRAVLSGPTTGGMLQLNDATASASLTLNGSNGSLNSDGSLNVVTSIGGAVQGSLYRNFFGAWLDLNDETGSLAIRGGASNVGGGGFWFLHNSSGVATVEIDGDDEADPGVGVIQVRNAAGAARVLLDGDSGANGGGGLSIVNGSGATTITLQGDVSGAGQVISDFLVVRSTLVTLTNNATLTPTSGYMRIVGSGGAVTLNGATAIANGAAPGTVLVLEGRSDISTVTVPDGANTILGVGRVLGLNDTLTMIWNGANWVQLAFANN